ncbi:MAG: DUF7266 family protein [Nanoarchaeota archaeon]
MKAQVTMEFVAFIGITVVLFSGIALAAYAYKTDVMQQQKTDELENFAKTVQKEIFLASTLHEGYQRVVLLPEKIQQESYSISILNDNLYVQQDGYEVILPLPDVDGGISGSQFTVEVSDGRVVIS